MKARLLEEKIVMPEGIRAELNKNMIIIKGVKGENKRVNDTPVDIIIDKDIILRCKSVGFRERTLFYTLKAHLLNMIKGAREGFNVRMKVCSGHFPMNVSADKNKVIIKNFLGEKVSRFADIVEGCNVKIDGDIITITGSDKERVGQTASNIEASTRISNKDRRVFQDGIYRLK